MPAAKHFDEARREGLRALVGLVAEEGRIERGALIAGADGRLRVVFWIPAMEMREALRARVREVMAAAAGEPSWTGEVWFRAPDIGRADDLVYARAWESGTPVPGSERVRLVDQHISRLAWFGRPHIPPWPAQAGSPRIVAFYSFKGGVGRTTALASFALRRARAGERVVALDLDFDAPGAGTLLAADEEGTTASWGVVDYLLEQPLGPAPLQDYFHTSSLAGLAAEGVVHCFPAGRLDEDYLTKVARLDVDSWKQPLAIAPLLQQIRSDLKPHWILLDLRAGLSPASGILLSGVAQAYVLFGTASRQSWLGLTQVVRRLGADRLAAGLPQAECVLAQAMVPALPVAAKPATAEFADAAEECLTETYYAESSSEDGADDSVWTMDDLDSSEAPHVPVVLRYQDSLAFFRHLGDVAEVLVSSPDLARLEERILGRFPASEGE